MRQQGARQLCSCAAIHPPLTCCVIRAPCPAGALIGIPLAVGFVVSRFVATPLWDFARAPPFASAAFCLLMRWCCAFGMLPVLRCAGSLHVRRLLPSDAPVWRLWHVACAALRCALGCRPCFGRLHMRRRYQCVLLSGPCPGCCAGAGAALRLLGRGSRADCALPCPAVVVLRRQVGPEPPHFLAAESIDPMAFAPNDFQKIEGAHELHLEELRLRMVSASGSLFRCSVDFRDAWGLHKHVEELRLRMAIGGELSPHSLGPAHVWPPDPQPCSCGPCPADHPCPAGRPAASTAGSSNRPGAAADG